MSHQTNETAAYITAVAQEAPVRAPSTKDAGRVHVGGGMMRFDQPGEFARKVTKDAGRVHVGGGMMRF